MKSFSNRAVQVHEFNAIVLSLSKNESVYFTVVELTQSSLSRMLSAGSSVFEIIDMFLLSGFKALSTGVFKKFKVYILVGNEWYQIAKSDTLPFQLNQEKNSPEFLRNMENFSRLTLAERKILKLSALGFYEKEIKKILEISINTFQTHRRSIYSKMEFRNKSQLTRWCDCYLEQFELLQK